MRTYEWLLSLMLVVGSSTWVAAAEGVDTLVTKRGTMIMPGMAKTWHADGTTVTFVLRDGYDGAVTAQTLNDRVAGIKATGAGTNLVVTGLAGNVLLEQLATLHLCNDADPLSDLGGLGGAVVASRTPESGGSIRAGKSVAVADITGEALPPPKAVPPAVLDANQRVDVEVVQVDREGFPHVVLHLKVRHAAKAAALAAYKPGTIFTGSITYTGKLPFDPTDATHVRNAVAYYLATGDKLWVHPVTAPSGNDNVVALDWLERPGVTLP